MRATGLVLTMLWLAMVGTAAAYENSKEAYDAGREGFRKHDYGQAVEDLRKAVELASKEPEKERAAVYLKLAEARYEEWLVRHKEGHPYHESRRLYLEAFGTYLEHERDKAREQFAQVLKVKGAYPAYAADAQFMIGYLWFSQRDYAKAREAFAAVLSVQNAPTVYTAKAHQYIGKCLMFDEKYADARREFEKAIDPLREKSSLSGAEHGIKSEVETQLESLVSR